VIRGEVRRERLIPAVDISRIIDLLEKLVNIFEENFPRREDDILANAERQTAAGSAITTITWYVVKGYNAYIKKLYVDAVSNVTYKWKVPFKQLEFEGNEIEFVRPLVIPSEKTLVLEMTNTGTTDQNVDILITGWGRKLG